MCPTFVRFLAITVAIALIAFHSLRFALAQAVLDSPLEGPIAVVNKDIVIYSQVRELVANEETAARSQLKDKELRDRIKELRMGALHELIDRALILQEFNKTGSQIPEDVVDQRIASIIREKFGDDRQAFLHHLEAQGYTLNYFRKLERDNIIVVQMRREIIAGKINVSETQISDYYRRYDTSGKPLTEIHDDIKRDLEQNESKRLQEDWLGKLRKDGYIKIY
jgi:parvulin-like peptidyl-prolyl isomerase